MWIQRIKNQIFYQESGWNLGFLRAIFFFFVIIVCARNRFFVSYNLLPSELWMPQGLFALIQEKPAFPYEIWKALHLLWQISLFTSMLGLFSRFSMAISAVMTFVIMGFAHSYGYQTHTQMPLVLAATILACSSAGDFFSLDSWRRKKTQPIVSDKYGWPIWSIKALLCLVFFSAGLSKLSQSGIEWVFSDHLKSVLERSYLFYPDIHQWASSFRFNEWLASSPLLVKVAAGITLIFELAAPLAIFARRYAFVIIPGLALIQVGIYFTMYVAFYTYAILYAFWIPWDWVFRQRS